MITNKTNGKKDRNQTLVEYLTYEAGSSFMAIAQHKAGRHKQTLAHVNQQSGEKIEAIACTALGVVVGVGGIMMGAVGLAVGGLAIAPFAGLALMARAKGEIFAAREHEFLRLNSQMLEYMAGMEQRGDLPTLDLADLYVRIFAERCHRNNLLVTPEVFKAALAGTANSRIGSKATVNEFAQAMETQVAMTLPIAPTVEPEYYEPEPEAPQAAPFRFSAFGDAIDVPAQQSFSSFEGGPIATLERTIQAEAPIGLPQQLIDVAIANPYSTFIIGMSAAGKDITLYNLVKSLKDRLPTSMFIGIDGKNHPGEKALWSDDIYDRTLHISMLDFVPDYHPKLINLLRDACEFPGGAIVTFSELNGIASSYAAAKLDTEWAEVAHYLRYLALQGNAYGKFFLSTAQGLTLKELGISTSARGNIKFMMLANGSQFGFVDSATANTNVFSRKLISDQNTFTAACSRSTALAHLPQANTDIGVAYFHSSLNRWEPMPRLVNPGNDRGQAPQKIAPTVAPQEPAKATRTEVGKALVAKAQAIGLFEALQQVKQLNEIGQERSAFRVLIEALGISSKTAFCKLLGVEGGAKFQSFGEVYDWVVG